MNHLFETNLVKSISKEAVTCLVGVYVRNAVILSGLGTSINRDMY